LPDPTTTLHTDPVQSALWHCAGRLQAVPVGSVGVQVPLLSQKLPLPHWGSVVHRTPESGCVPPSRVPIEPTQVDVAVSHTGRSLGQFAFDVHCTQAPVVGSQMGVLPEHWELVRHPTHTPAFGPVVAQSPERQSVGPSAAVHGPSPLA